MKSFIEVTSIAECVVVAVNESSLSRVWKQTTEHDSGTITAFRYASDCGNGQVYSKKDNMKRNKILESILLQKGYSITKVKGTYIENYGSSDAIEVKENAFLVVDIKDSGSLKSDLAILGLKFEQDSITYSKASGEYYLIGTNKCPNGYPKFKKIIKLGKSMFGKKGEFYSRVNGRPFVFESVENNLYKLTDFPPTEIRGILANS